MLADCQLAMAGAALIARAAPTAATVRPAAAVTRMARRRCFFGVCWMVTVGLLRVRGLAVPSHGSRSAAGKPPPRVRADSGRALSTPDVLWTGRHQGQGGW